MVEYTFAQKLLITMVFVYTDQTKNMDWFGGLFLLA